MEEKWALERQKDRRLTTISLTFIVVQAIIIIFGMVYRWDWLAYECAAVLIISAVYVTYHGVLAVLRANKLMMEERRIDEEVKHGKD